MPRQAMDIEKDLVLLLAASIQPNPTIPRLARTDPKLRENDYITALRYYLTEHPRVRKFIFVENSGWPLDRVRGTIGELGHDAEIDFLSVNCNDRPGGRFDIAYGESEMIRRALDQSPLALGAKYIAKLTGRLRLRNLTRLLELAPLPLRMYCDLQSHYVPFQLDNTSKSWLAVKWAPRHYYQCDTRFYVFTREFYDTHLRTQHEIPRPEGFYWIEGVWYKLMSELASEPGVTVRFAIQPHYSGINGGLGFDYDSPKETAKRLFRGMNRRLFPWWWF